MTTANMLMQAFVMLCFFLAVALTLWLYGRSPLRQGGRGAIPAGAPPLERRWRALQAGVIAAVGLGLVYFIGLAGNGPLGFLDHLNPAVRANVRAVTGCVVAGVLAGAALALLWRSDAGVLCAALALILYCALDQGMLFTQNGGILPQESAITKSTLAFEVSDNLPGVEIWVNDVYLGQTPLDVPLEDFKRKVPVWDKEPATTRSQEYWRNTAGGRIRNSYSPWIRFSVIGPSPVRPVASVHPRDNSQTYYARVRLDGVPGYGSGSSGGNGGGGSYEYRFTTHLGTVFPEREDRIDKLIAQARLRDYRPGPQWFKAMESFDQQGWNVMTGLIDKEPGMRRVADAWAAWHYGLEKIQDAGSARQALEALAREAEARGEFDTASLAGRAVALLAPRLETASLVDAALGYLGKNYSNYQYSYTTLGERFEFASRRAPGEDPRLTLPLRAYVVAQAIRCQAGLARERGEAVPAALRDRLAPALVSRHYDNETALRIAAGWENPAVDQFLLRHDWRQVVDWPRHMEDSTWIGGTHVNRWLYLLAGLDNDLGGSFRAAHPQDVLNLAAQLLKGSMNDSLQDLSFLFLDPRLALQYWPQYHQTIPAHSFDTLRKEWAYLVRMEPLATNEMYLQTWRERLGGEQGYISENGAFEELDRLDPKRRIEILRLLEAEAESRLAVPKAGAARNHGAYDSLRDSILPMLRKKRAEAGDVDVADAMLEQMESASGGQGGRGIDAMAEWLVQGPPGNPLLARLAREQDPRLRQLTLAAVEACPAAENRKILETLAKDPDAGVATAAREAQGRLAELDRTPPEKLAAR